MKKTFFVYQTAVAFKESVSSETDSFRRTGTPSSRGRATIRSGPNFERETERTDREREREQTGIEKENRQREREERTDQVRSLSLIEGGLKKGKVGGFEFLFWLRRVLGTLKDCFYYLVGHWFY